MRAAPELHREYVVRGVRVHVPDGATGNDAVQTAAATPQRRELMGVALRAPRRPARQRRVLDQPPHHWRALIAEPGVRRRLPAIAFRGGNGVNAGADVACNVQIFEATAPQRRAELAASILRATGESAPLLPLTAAVAAQLGLTTAFRNYRPPRALWRERDVVLPGERFVQVRTVRSTAGIPSRYLRPWEFRLSRSEALFDMQHPARPGVIRRILDRVGRRARLARWRALLDGHTALEQLWGVRPPQRGYQDPEVIAWARRMLAGAGYDAERWLSTWELFWRRKGV